MGIQKRATSLPIASLKKSVTLPVTYWAGAVTVGIETGWDHLGHKKRHGKPAGCRSFYGILFANGVKHPPICSMHITRIVYIGLPATPQVKIVSPISPAGLQITILEFAVSWCIAPYACALETLVELHLARARSRFDRVDGGKKSASEKGGKRGIHKKGWRDFFSNR